MVSRDAVLAKARGWLDRREEPDGSNNVEFSRDWGIVGQSWCFAFVQSCFWYADPSPSGKLPHQSMYCPYGIQWARDNGQAIEVGQGDPLPGDIVFFSWDMATWPRSRPGTGDHVGIVEDWDGGDVVHTIEGNIGSPQGVWRKDRSISETVVCFWRPLVFDNDSFGVAGQIQEDDMFEQADRDRLQQVIAAVPSLVDQLKEIRNYAGGSYDQGVAANSRLVEIRDFAGGAHDQGVAANSRLVDLIELVKTLAASGVLNPSEHTVDMNMLLGAASPEQLATLGTAKLIDALRLALAPKAA